MMTKTYSDWRENQIKEIGAPLQHKAEEFLDARDHMPMIDMVNNETGQNETCKKDVADVYQSRKTHKRIGTKNHKTRGCYSVPDIPGFTS